MSRPSSPYESPISTKFLGDIPSAGGKWVVTEWLVKDRASVVEGTPVVSVKSLERDLTLEMDVRADGHLVQRKKEGDHFQPGEDLGYVKKRRLSRESRHNESSPVEEEESEEIQSESAEGFKGDSEAKPESAVERGKIPSPSSVGGGERSGAAPPPVPSGISQEVPSLVTPSSSPPPLASKDKGAKDSGRAAGQKPGSTSQSPLPMVSGQDRQSLFECAKLISMTILMGSFFLAMIVSESGFAGFISFVAFVASSVTWYRLWSGICLLTKVSETISDDHPKY